MTTTLPADDLPAGFPADKVPVISGRVVRTETGEAAGAPPGKQAWLVGLAVDRDVDDCFREAVDALGAHGLRATQAFSAGPGRQAFFESEGMNVIVSASEISGECRIWYLVGPDGLRIAG